MPVVAKRNLHEKITDGVIHGILILLALLCLLPLVNVLAVSFSSRAAAEAGKIKLWPVDFTLNSYRFIVTRSEFLEAFWITIQRVVIGTGINMFLVVLMGYALSKDSRKFRTRTVYSWFLFLTLLFNGGLIPTYMTVRFTGLIDKLWALILPTGVQVFNVILMLNFFRKLPSSLEDSAAIDGAGHFTILFRIYLPLSTAAIATLTLFCAVFHWNSWFDGMIYMNSPDRYPLQTYLRSMILRLQSILSNVGSADSEQWQFVQEVSDRTARSAQIFAGALPIILVYPFLQRYFVKGMVLGSVKG
jgi:putative aldouronate transport system permease protein